MKTNKPRFTAKVRRGLRIFRSVLIDALDPDSTPVRWQMKKWKKSEESDFNAAMAWLEVASGEFPHTANPEPTASTDPAPLTPGALP